MPSHGDAGGHSGRPAENGEPVAFWASLLLQYVGGSRQWKRRLKAWFEELGAAAFLRS